MKKDRLDKRITVRLSKRHYDMLCAAANDEGTDAAAIIRHLVARFVKDRFTVIVPKLGGF
jgi:hypothetical protein